MTPLINKWTSAVAVLVMLGVGISACLAGGGGYGGGGYRGGGYGGGGFAGGRNNINLRQLILSREQQNVIVPDDEWAIIEPKLWKVVTLQALAKPNPNNFAATAVRRILSQNAAQIDMDPSVAALSTDILRGENNLMAALEDPNTPENQIEIKLRDYRTTRDKARQELKLAEADLQRILTLRQESVLLTDGFID